MDIEHIVHGEHNVHHHVDEANYRPKNKVLYQDIIDLGLSEEQLKGIDLNKLLDQEKREFENWQRDEMGNDANDASYWQEVRDLRKEYLQKIYSKIRELSQPDLDTAEWDQGDDDIRGMKDPQQLHAGESELEHEMEMWGRTEPKENRKAYNVLHGRRGMNEEEEGGQGENKSDEEAEEERTLNM
ncbi:uncharacterized protein LOC131949976 isoform X2 [Physella acuta]|uniref:uncharacterized protein LOC131949976 isoform X2 n=1 Tax=Physella acuta TaxID=109671 RepID=UPI0027DC4830|nr:uncharacterized protein LOC131949976 isoform X2 [Physella acuta]